MARSNSQLSALFTVAVALALVLGGVVIPIVTASPAAAALNGAIPANGDDEPTDVFTTQDVLKIITLSDFAGGRACVIPEFVDNTCEDPAWGEPNAIVGLGTTFGFLEGPALEPGHWRLRTEFRKDKDTWEKGSISDVFTVLPCGPGECLDSLGEEQAKALKDASREALGGARQVCHVARFLASKKKAAIDVAISIVSGDFISAGIGALGLFDIEIPNEKTGEEKAVQILNTLSCNILQMHQDIVDDPPDPDFTIIATANPATNPPLETATQQEYADALAQQEALGRATLKSYERYQGALLAGDATYQLKQSQAIERFTEQLGASLHRGARASRALADSTDPLDTALTSFVTFQTQDQLDQTAAVFDRLRATGLTPGESAEFDNLGLDQVAKADYLARLTQTDVSTLSVGGTLADALRGQADHFDAAVRDTLRFGRNAGNVAAGLGGQPANKPPTANDDAFSAQTAVASSLNVLANDTDPEGDPLQVVATTDPGNGVVSCSPAGNCVYRSADGFQGADSFGYTVRDAAGGTASATVRVSVTSAPVPPRAGADSIDAVSAHAVDVSVLQNDNDPAGFLVTVTAGGPAGHGTVSCSADTCTYRSDIGYSGPDEFPYTIRSESGLTAVGTVAVTVAPNGAPVLSDQQATVTSATPLTVNVLQGSSDPEFDSLTVTEHTAPVHGTVTCGPTTCTYTSAIGYTGDDSFRFTVSDRSGGTSDATVALSVIENTAPNVSDDTVVTRVGRTDPLVIDVVGNDGDAESLVGEMDLAVVDRPSHGSVTCGPLGSDRCQYVADPTYIGVDSFTYRLTDPGGASGVGSVAITVTENHAPAFADPQLSTFKETLISRDVLGYASDSDGDSVSLKLGDQPAHGVVTCDSRSCEYTPAAGFVGDDSFTVVLTDGELSTTGVVSVAVRPYCYPAVCIDNGTVLLAVNPFGDLNAPDGTGSKAGQGSVGLDFLPTNNDATAAGCLCEGWGVADPQTGDAGFANVSSDGGAPNLTVESFTSTATTAVSVVRAGTSFRVTHDYHPSAKTSNLYEVTVTIENISGATIPDVLYRRVMDWDIEPTAFAEYSTIDTGNASEIRFTNDNGFASANPLSSAEGGGGWTSGEFTDLGPIDHGALFDFGFGEIPAGGSKVFQTYYGAAADEVGAQSALATVGAEAYSFGQPSTEDGPTLGTPNTFVFAFRSVGGQPVFAPTAVDDKLTVNFQTAGSVDVLGNDTDPNGDPLSVTTPSPAAAHGVATCKPTGACTYTPEAGFSGEDSFTYAIADGTGGTSTATVKVTVSPPPGSPPVAVISPASGPEASAIALDGSGSTDPDGDPLTYAWDLDADGAFDDASTATASLTIPVAGSRRVGLQVTDPAGHTAVTERTITATNVNPLVSAGADVTTGQEHLYSGTGSFVDPGADSWRATIDWGAGSGPEPLALSGFTFSTAHFFAAPGNYTVTVRVTDVIGAGEGTDSFVVSVPPPPVNLPPTAGLSPIAPTGDEGSTIAVGLSAADPESGPLTADWSWSANPLGPTSPDCVLSSTTITGAAISCNENGTVTLSVTVSDGVNAVTRSVPVLVTNSAPAVGAISTPGEITLGSSLEIYAPFSDPGTVDTHVCSVRVDGTTVDGAITGEVCAATITGLAAGPHGLELTVTDDEGDSGRAVATVVVTSPPPATGTPETSSTVASTETTPETSTSVTSTVGTSTPETSVSSTESTPDTSTSVSSTVVTSTPETSTSDTSTSATSTPETSTSTSATSTPETSASVSSTESPPDTSTSVSSTGVTTTPETSTSDTSAPSTDVTTTPGTSTSVSSTVGTTTADTSPSSTTSTSVTSTVPSTSTSTSPPPPPTCSRIAPTVDAQVWADQPTASTRFVSPKFSTAFSGELVLAFVSADGPSAKPQKVTEVTGGGLTWSLAVRSNQTWGTTEVWQARASSRLTNAAVTAKLTGAYDGSIVIATFNGASSAVAAIGAAAGKKGGPGVTVVPRYCGSVVWATGHDWSAAQDPTLAAGQSMVHKFIDTRVKDSFWFEKAYAPTTAGAPVTLSAAGFTTDRWTLAAVEIPGALAAK